MSGKKGQVFLIAAIMLAMMFMATRPLAPLELEAKENQQQLVMDNIYAESQDAVNIAYFSNSSLMDYFLSQKQFLNSRLMGLDGYYVLFYPNKTFEVGNFFDSKITGTLNISGKINDIDLDSREIETGNFSSFGQAKLGLTTVHGSVYHEKDLKKKLDTVIELWVSEDLTNNTFTNIIN